jgi:uncharacterized protein YndB with AHSA1/START domain
MKRETESIRVCISTKESLNKVWNYFTNPEHIVHWNHASEDWHCPKATNDLKVGGHFVYTMASKDGKMSFDFNGLYSEVVPLKRFVYNIEDGRKVTVTFDVLDRNVILTEIFEPENQNPIEMQRGGWQSILDTFKKYLEQ